MRHFKGPISVLPSHNSCLHSNTTSQLKISLYIGSRFCFIKGRAAQNRPSPRSMVRVRYMPKWPWGEILKEIAPDSFPLAIFCFPHRFFLSFPHLSEAPALCPWRSEGNLLWVPRTEFWLCTTMPSSSTTSSSNSYSLWLFCLFLCCSATHTRASEGKVTVDFLISNILNINAPFC